MSKTTLDEILGQAFYIEDGEYIGSYQEGYSIGFDIKQAILDWHNKKVEEVLDRIEATKTIYKARAHNDKGVLRTMIVTTAIPLDAIQAERDKLKGSKND